MKQLYVLIISILVVSCTKQAANQALYVKLTAASALPANFATLYQPNTTIPTKWGTVRIDQDKDTRELTFTITQMATSLTINYRFILNFNGQYFGVVLPIPAGNTGLTAHATTTGLLTAYTFSEGANIY